MLQGVQVRCDQKQIGAALDRQEARPRYVDSVGIVEVLDGRAGSCFKLNDWFTGVGGFVVDNDLQIKPVVIHDTLDSSQVNPKRVGVEDPE